MARKRGPGEVNKSQAIRDLLQENPDIKATEAVKHLGDKGIKIAPGLFYFTKGKVTGGRRRRRKMRRDVAAVTGNSNKGDVLGTIRKVKNLAAEVGGLGKLRALVEALSE